MPVFRSVGLAAAVVAGIIGVGVARGDAAAASHVINNNVPGLARFGKPAGVTDTAKVIDVMVWLKIRNKAGLDALAVDLYNPQSARYRQWIKPADFGRDYAPAAEDAKTVEKFFAEHGLTGVAVGPKNMYVRARGTVAQVNKAFHVQLHNVVLKGQTYYVNSTDPVVDGAAGELTGSVYGLHNLQYTHPHVTRSIRSSSGANADAHAATAFDSATAPPISQDCFSGVETEYFDNAGTYPLITLKGNGYAATAGSLGGCGYTPPEIQKAYHLTDLYKQQFDGTGQTIVIIDWCGSPTITADANTFSAVYGLPALTSANFKIINSSTPPVCGSPDVEINIDVEWAHAIAPGAAIDLVVPPTASFADVDTGEFYAVINGLGSVISGSYGSEEAYDTPAELAAESLINEIAAVEGIAANFSSGDAGDYTFDASNTPSVSAPADSPYATAVGGVSLALKSDDTIAWQTGWGTNLTLIETSGEILDPPTEFSFFNFGSGGGPSAVFAKPSYQHKLPGGARLLPDISWLADPFTGGVIVISEPFQYPEQVYEVYGGTSLACPMFAALWAIANQEAGVSLGQAAPYLYSMPASAITDVLPKSSSSNVTASYKESPTITDKYSAVDLAGPLEGTTEFYSAIWNYPLVQDTIYVLTFGTDSGLETKKGWDDVTGLGTPNGKTFADFFHPAAVKAD